MTRPGLRTPVIRALQAAMLVAAAALPPWLETEGEEAVRMAWSCGDAATACGTLGSLDLHAEGLSLGDAQRDVGSWRIGMTTIDVAPTAEGIGVRLRGVTIARVEPAARAPSVEPATPGAARVATGPRRRPVPSTHGLAVDIAIDDAVQMSGPRGSALTIDEAHARLDGHGGLEVDARVQVEHDALRATPSIRAHATVQDADLARWRGSADVLLAEGEPPIRVDAILEGERRQLVAWSGGGAVTVRPLGPRAVVLAADAFPVAAALSPFRGIDLPEGMDAGAATISGTIEAHLQDHPRVHLTDVQVDGLVVDDPRVAREPLAIDALEIAGDLGLVPGGGFADVVLAHAGAELGLRASLDADRIALELELPEHECQTVLDALPGAMKDTLGGMRLAGRIEGHMRLTIDRTALVDARGSYEGAPGEVPPRPGELDLSLPVLETCTVTADPAAIDLGALLGPYRHRFATASGDDRTRTLAPGAPGFAPLSSVRLVADAFVTLEDRRFFGHDGFDREQMANALWHNVVRGGVHRGASTISQQATRNLWLGVDRSLSRKLQEALLTSRLEAEVPKDRILELYLNVIELGPDVHGVEAAAQYWFGKPAADLDVRESVHLAALAPAPRRFARRFASGEVDDAWNEMIDRQIRRMWLAGRISAAERDRALRSALRIVAHP